MKIVSFTARRVNEFCLFYPSPCLHRSANRATITGSVPILSDNTVRYAKPFIWLLTVIPLFPTSRRLRALHKSCARNVATARREISTFPSPSLHPPFHPPFHPKRDALSLVTDCWLKSHPPLHRIIIILYSC